MSLDLGLAKQSAEEVAATVASKSTTYRLVTSFTPPRPNAIAYDSFFPHPFSYNSGWSHASSHASQGRWLHCDALNTSHQTWSSQSMTHRVSYPSATHSCANALANSPQRPRRVSSSFDASLYRGNRVVTAPSHVAEAHAYASTLDAPCARSFAVGGVIPTQETSSGPDAPQTSHGGASHHRKNSRLNHRSSRRSRASSCDISFAAGDGEGEDASAAAAAAAAAAARAAVTSSRASASSRSSGTTLRATAFARSS